MANTQVPSFAPDTSVGTSFGQTSAAVLLPGTPASDSILKVTNLGPCHISVKMGTSNAVTVTINGGLIICAGQTEYLTLGANTYIAGVASGGNSTVSLTTGN